MGWNWDAVSLIAGQIQACIRYTQSYARCMYTPLRREHAGCACDPSICTSETCNLQPASRGPRQGLSSSQETSVCGAVGVWAWEPAARHARGSNGVLLHRRAHITCNQGNQAINQRHSARTASAALHATQFQFKGQTEKDYQRLKREIDVMMAPGLRRLVRPVITKGTWHGLSDFGSYSAVLVILLYSGIAPSSGPVQAPSMRCCCCCCCCALTFSELHGSLMTLFPRIANSLAVSRFLACMYPRRHGPQGHAPERPAVNIIIHVRVRRAAQDSSGPEAAFPLGAMKGSPAILEKRTGCGGGKGYVASIRKIRGVRGRTQQSVNHTKTETSLVVYLLAVPCTVHHVFLGPCGKGGSQSRGRQRMEGACCRTS